MSRKLLSMHKASARVHELRSSITTDEMRSHEIPRHMPRIRIGIQWHRVPCVSTVVGTQSRGHHEGRAARALGFALQKCHSRMHAASQSDVILKDATSREAQRADCVGEMLAAGDVRLESSTMAYLRCTCVIITVRKVRPNTTVLSWPAD